MKGLSAYEKLSVALAACFLLICSVYFYTQRSVDEPYRVELSRQPGQSQAVPDPSAPEDWPDSLLPGERINVNTAPAGDLTRLPNIGEKRAADIVEWRETHGPFQSVDDLTEVPGIGEKTLERLREYITVSTTD